MKKLCKLARKFDMVAKVLFWLCVTVGVICAIFMIAIPSLPELFFEDVTITLGTLEMQLAPTYTPNREDMRIFLFSMCLLTIVVSVFACLVIRIIRNILKPMKVHQPFDSVVSTNLKKLSWTILIGDVLAGLIFIVIQIIEYRIFDFPNLFLSDKIISCKLSYTFDASCIVIFGILYLMSYIFRYGEELQKQSDETL